VFRLNCDDHHRWSKAGDLSMRRFRLRAAGMLTASLLACGADSAVANPLTPFRYESQAQRHCPADVVVWLDLGRRIY
jgi:hypothetical protein